MGSSSTTARALEAVALSCLLLGVAAAAFHPIYSVDFFWHLKLGEVIAETRAIPRINLFSSAEPLRPYVQFNWLWDVAAAEVVRAFGLRGFRVAQVLVLVASYLLLHLRVRRVVSLPEAALAFTALALVMFEDRFQERPSAWLLGFVALAMPLWFGAHRRVGARVLAGAFGLGVLWANVHGGESLLLPCSAFALLCGELGTRWFFPGRTTAVKDSALLFGVTLVAIAVSPTALPGLWDWAHAIGPQIAIGNEEWQPSWTMLRNGARPAFVIIGLGPTLVALAYAASELRRVRREGRDAIDLAEWFLCAGLLVLAHQAVRNAFLCLVPVAFMLRRATALQTSTPARVGSAAVAVLLLGIAVEDALPYGYGGWSRVVPSMALDLAPNEQPELAADFLVEAKIRGGMLNDGRWGGYLIHRAWPQVRVFADTRHHFTAEMFPVFMASHEAVTRAQALDLAFTRWGVELAVFRGPSFPLLVPPPRWRLLYKAGDQEVYQHVYGRHAAQNVAGTLAYLRAHGGRVSEEASAAEVALAATRVGAQRYLSTPHQRAVLAGAEHDRRSTDPRVSGAAARERGLVLYRAGMYAEAATLFDEAIAKGSGDATTEYCAAFARYATGEHARSLELARALWARADQLTRRQRDRLALLLRTLTAAKA